MGSAGHVSEIRKDDAITTFEGALHIAKDQKGLLCAAGR